MNKPDLPLKAINPTGKRPRTIRQQLEHDAWINHGRHAKRMAGRMTRRRRAAGAGMIEPGPARNRRSLSRQDRTLLAVSLVLLLLLLFARASMAQGQTGAEAARLESTVESTQESTLSRSVTNIQGIELWGIEFRRDDAPQFSAALDTDIKAEITGLDTRTDRVSQLDWKPDFGPDTEPGPMPWEKTGSLLSIGSSVNLARFSSTATGWKAQLAYSLATLLCSASLLWFSTPSHRVQAGGSPPLPGRAH